VAVANAGQLAIDHIYNLPYTDTDTDTDTESERRPHNCLGKAIITFESVLCNAPESDFDDASFFDGDLMTSAPSVEEITLK
jgi:hypothetical protein